MKSSVNQDIMITAFIIAFVVAVFFIILWSEEKEKRAQAEQRIKQLSREIKKLKSKSEPAKVVNPKKPKEYVIPQPPKKKEAPLLDQGKLAELKEQTRAAQDMLAEIFNQEEETPAATGENSKADYLRTILEKLLSKGLWTRNEIEELLGPSVMVGNVLEQINDYAYPIVNDIVVEEDGDNIYVTTDYKEQLI